MATTAQLIFVLSGLVSITVSGDVFGLVDGSVQLNIQDPVPQFDDFFWVFNGTKNVLKYNKHDVRFYKDRAQFNNKTYSLTLKNLKKTDSGQYEARVSGEEITVIATYKLSVLDPVEAPNLTYELSNDTCNITLTCRGHDLSISSSCYKETCEEKTETSQNFKVSLFISGSSIICNHSNPVSWRESVVEINKLKPHCADKEKVKADPNPKWLLPVLVSVGFIGIIAIAAICWYLKRRRSTGLVQCENTVYAEVENPAQPQNNDAEMESMTILETLPPSTVYATVGNKHQPPSNGVSSPTTSDLETQHPKTKMGQGIPNTYETVPEKETHQVPETIYSTVSKVSRPVTEAK